MTNLPRVIGLDLSLTATGLAENDLPERIRAGDLRECVRLHWLLRAVMSRITMQIGHDAADLVILEGPAYSRSLQAGHHESAGLWWLIKWSLFTEGIPAAVVPPNVLKKYATGKGTATKADMRVALFKRASLDLRDDNECDAWWLRAMGLDHLGHPPIELPQAQRDVLAKVAWPEVPDGQS